MTPTVSLLEREIRSQPTVLGTRGDVGAERAREIVEQFRIGGADHLVLAARGSSDNAARFGQYLLGGRARLLVSLAAPSLFAEPATAPLLPHAGVLAVSQSGQSPDIVSVLLAAHAQLRPTAAITNDLTSPLAQAADLILPLGCEPEQAIAATRTYTLSLVAFAELADAFDPAGAPPWAQQLPALVADTIDTAFAAHEVLALLTDVASLSIVGRGLGFSAAMEAALKLREVTGILAEAWSPPDLLHGPIAGLHRQSAAILLTTPDFPRDYWQDVAAQLLPRVSVLLVLSDDPQLRALGHGSIALPAGIDTWITSLLAVVCAQVLSVRIGAERGMDVDNPRGLVKVTRTH